MVIRRASEAPSSARRGRGSSASAGVKADQADLQVARGAQKVHRLHHIAIGNGLVGAHENALRPCRFGSARPAPHARRARAPDPRQAQGSETGFERQEQRLVRPLRRLRGRGRQIDIDVDRRKRRRHHEDDQKNQNDVDEGGDVDLVIDVEIFFVRDASRTAIGSLRRTAHGEYCDRRFGAQTAPRSRSRETWRRTSAAASPSCAL